MATYLFFHMLPAAFLFQKKSVYTCTVIYKTFFNLGVWISLIPTRLCLSGYSITTHIPTCYQPCGGFSASPDVFMLEEKGEPKDESLRCGDWNAPMLGWRERGGPGADIMLLWAGLGFWWRGDIALGLIPVVLWRDSLGLFIDPSSESVGLLGINRLSRWLTLLKSPPVWSGFWTAWYPVSMVGRIRRGFPVPCLAPNCFWKA